ncbi:caspase family protein [Streptomyces sp. NPDC003016]
MGAAGEEKVRRLIVVGGTSRYEHHEELPAVPGDLDAVTALFEGLGYEPGGRLHDRSADGFRRELSDWAASQDRTDDALVLYYSGHGDHDHDRHYLLFRDSRTDRLTGTALATEDIARTVTECGFERLLLIVDTCYAGQGGLDAARRVATDLGRRLSTTRAAEAERLTAFCVIAAARSRDEAADGAFTRALTEAVDDLTVGGPRQPKLYLEQVVDRVNESLRRHSPHQYAALGILPTGEGYPFFPNPRHVPDLPHAVMDLAEQSTWSSAEGRRRRAELQSHFAPRGRGTDGIGGRGSYFTGRLAALGALSSWLDGDSAELGRCVVVTGSAGVGKSSLLGRTVLLADPVHRQALTDVPPAVPPPRTRIDAAIHARHHVLEEIAAGIADAAGLDDAHPQYVLEALAGRTEPLTLVIDALDEAGPAAGGTEPLRIAGALLHPLSRIPCVRLLVGTRPHVVGALGPELTVLDLDDSRWIGLHDIEHYARKLLLAPDGPGSTGPYREEETAAIAREVAHRAGRNFLVARLTARALAHGAQLTGAGAGAGAGADDWRRRLPPLAGSSARPAGPVFRWALHEQLGEREQRGRALLGALALAEGPGLPAGAVWRAMASALTGDDVSADDIGWILGAANAHLVEDVDRTGRSVYRLYHESFADELREEWRVAPHGTPHDAPGTKTVQVTAGRVARALLDLVPADADGSGRNWPAADPYLLDHLPTHAADGGLLDELVPDPLFLVTVDQDTLRRALPRVRTPRADAVRSAYERIAPRLAAEPDAGARAALLRLTALEAHNRELADAALSRFPAQPWVAEWAFVPSAPYPHRSVGDFPGGVNRLVLLDCAGRRTLVTQEGNLDLRVWDTETCAFLGHLPQAPQTYNRYVSAMATCPGGHGGWLLIAVSEGPSGQVTVWDVGRRAPWGSTVETAAEAIALAGVGDTLVAALVTLEGVVLLVDMRDGTELCRLTVEQAEQPPAPEETQPRIQLRSWVALDVHEGDLVVAAVFGEFVGGRESDGRVWKWTVRPDDGWRPADARSWCVRGKYVMDLVAHRGQVLAATLDPRPEHPPTPVDTLVEYDGGYQEWTCRSSTGLVDEDRFVLCGRGMVRLAIGVDSAEVVDAQGHRQTVLHGRMETLGNFDAVAVGTDEVLLVTGTHLRGPVSMRVFRLDGSRAGTAKPRRFSALFGMTLSPARVARREVLALADDNALCLLDPGTGQVITWTPKRRDDRVVGARGLPLVTHDWRPRRGDHWPVRLLGAARRRMRLRNCPPGKPAVLHVVGEPGRGAVLALIDQQLVLWSWHGRKLCTVGLNGRGGPDRPDRPDRPDGPDGPVGKVRDLVCAAVGDRLFAAYCTREDGLRVLELPAGTTALHLEQRPGFTVDPGMSWRGQAVGFALGDWDGEPVVGHLFSGDGIRVHRIRDGALLWSWKPGPALARHFRTLQLHHVGACPVAVTVGFDDYVTLFDMRDDREVCRIFMGSPVQCLTPLPDGRIAAVTDTGVFCLGFPGLSSARAAPSYDA